jgi:Uma2 family endonuclease
MARTLARWSLNDYRQMIEKGLLANRQVELINGQILNMVPELPIHRATNRRGAKYLETLLGDRAVIFSASPITLPDDGEPQPDLCIAIPPESRYDQRHPQPDDIYWLVEISNSTLAYDLKEKAQLYAEKQIQEYWVLDLAGRQLWRHLDPQNGRYRSVVAVATGKIRPLALPQIEVEVGQLFPETR